MNFSIIMKNQTADSKKKGPPKIDFRADGTHESHPTAWELNSPRGIISVPDSSKILKGSPTIFVVIKFATAIFSIIFRFTCRAHFSTITVETTYVIYTFHSIYCTFICHSTLIYIFSKVQKNYFTENKLNFLRVFYEHCPSHIFEFVRRKPG